MAPFHALTDDTKEDAPALDSLQTYEVKIRDGNVYVLVDDEKLSSSRRHPPCARRSPQSSETVVIVGGGASGAAAAQKLREVTINKRNCRRFDRKFIFLPIRKGSKDAYALCPEKHTTLLTGMSSKK